MRARGVGGAEWQLALPLALAYAAFFLVPLLLLIVVSAFDNETLTTVRFAQWRKFYGDQFYWKVIVDTLEFEDLGGKTRLTVTSLFASLEDRDGMLATGMEGGANESWDRLAALLKE